MVIIPLLAVIIKPLNPVLLVNDSDPASVARVPVAVGNVIVAAPELVDIEEIAGKVNVLLVKVWVPFRTANTSNGNTVTVLVPLT